MTLWRGGLEDEGDYKAISPTVSQPAATGQPPATSHERREGRAIEGRRRGKKGREVRGRKGEGGKGKKRRLQKKKKKPRGRTEER